MDVERIEAEGEDGLAGALAPRLLVGGSPGGSEATTWTARRPPRICSRVAIWRASATGDAPPVRTVTPSVAARIRGATAAARAIGSRPVSASDGSRMPS
jgi:hypothetical protein